MKKYCLYLSNSEKIVATFNTYDQAFDYMTSLDRGFTSNTDEIRKIDIEKSNLDNFDFVTWNGNPYKFILPY